MTLKLKSKNIITPEGLFDGFIRVENGVIADITKDDFSAEEGYDFGTNYVSPGFIDIHTHGGGGNAFMESCADEVARGCDFHLAHGTTSIVPTVSAAEISVMKKAVETIAEVMERKMTQANVLGAHLEGPYLSEKQSGAQCPRFITPPVEKEYKEVVKELGGYIARWTYAPENDEKGRFCRFLTEEGIVASAGHTDAVYADMKEAIANGCNLITHLYSCTSTVTRKGGFRSLGVIETAFLEDGLSVEIIADGKHLPPELVKMIVKLKGEDSVALVTDSLALAGTEVKEGVMSGTEFVIEDGVCKLKDRSAFAGSIATADRLIRVLVKDCEINVVSAVKMMTATPAKIMKLDRKGRIAKGFDADFAVFDKDIKISAVFVGGKRI